MQIIMEIFINNRHKELQNQKLLACETFSSSNTYQSSLNNFDIRDCFVNP